MLHVEMHNEDMPLAKAAPQLLAALKRLTKPLELGVIDIDAWDEAERAIAAAEGRAA